MGLFNKLFRKSNDNAASGFWRGILTHSQSAISVDASVQNVFLLKDILPDKAITWKKGTIFWTLTFNKKGELYKVNEGDVIATILIQYSRPLSSIQSKIVKEDIIPIISNSKGVLLTDVSWHRNNQKCGKFYMEGEKYIDGSPIISRGDEAYLFSLFRSIEDVANHEVKYNIEEDPITKNSKIMGFESNILRSMPFADRINEYHYEGGKQFAYLIYRFTHTSIKQIQKITLLFEKGEIITLNIDKKLTSYEKNDWMDTKFKLSNELLSLLSSQKIKMIRFTLSNEDIVDNPIEEINAEYFMAYSAKFAEALAKCGWIPECPASNAKEGKNLAIESCYVYLMFDEANGFYKIGISNKPEYREHTLQSEKPTIVLVKAKQFPVRPLAEAFEAALHKTYDVKRIRGEWFNLEAKDVADIITTLS